MILRYYGTYTSIAKIRNYTQTDKNGTTVLGLVIGAKQFGLESKVIRTDMGLFLGNVKKQLSSPFIVHVNWDKGLQHYLVVLETHKNYILIADPDPDYKISKITYREFSQIWTGIVIFLKPDATYVPRKDDTDGLSQTLRMISEGLFVAYIFHGVFLYVQGILSTVLVQRLSLDILGGNLQNPSASTVNPCRFA